MIQQKRVSYIANIPHILLACLMVWGPMIVLMYMTTANPKNAANCTDFYTALEEQGYFMYDSTEGYRNKNPGRKFKKVISAVDGGLNVNFMEFEDIESAKNIYYNIVDTVSSRLIKNGEIKRESRGGKSNFYYYKLETDKNYAHIVRVGNTIAVADSPITEKDKIISIMNEFGYNYDISMNKTGFIGSMQFSNIAFIFFIVSLPICVLCRQLYYVELCEVCGKKRWEVRSNKIEIIANTMNKRIGQAEFEEWMFRETTEKYKAKKLMSLYNYFFLPSILFSILAFAFRKNCVYNPILLIGLAIISAMLIYTVIFTIKNHVIKKWIHGD